MDYWEKADYSWSDDSKRHILTPSSKSRTLFYYIQESLAPLLYGAGTFTIILN